MVIVTAVTDTSISRDIESSPSVTMNSLSHNTLTPESFVGDILDTFVGVRVAKIVNLSHRPDRVKTEVSLDLTIVIITTILDSLLAVFLYEVPN